MYEENERYGRIFIEEEGKKKKGGKENDQLVGVVSLGDLVTAIISEQESQIRGLENYILYHTSMPQ